MITSSVFFFRILEEARHLTAWGLSAPPWRSSPFQSHASAAQGQLDALSLTLPLSFTYSGISQIRNCLFMQIRAECAVHSWPSMSEPSKHRGPTFCTCTHARARTEETGSRFCEMKISKLPFQLFKRAHLQVGNFACRSLTNGTIQKSTLQAG